MFTDKQLDRLLRKLIRFESILENMMFEKVGELANLRQYQTKERRMKSLPMRTCTPPVR